jgi:hypothetical protein
MVLVSHELYWYDVKRIYQNVDVYKFNFAWLNLHFLARGNLRPNSHGPCVMTRKVVLCKTPLPIITILQILLFGVFCISLYHVGSIK